MTLLLSFVLLSVATLFILSMKHNAWGRDETIMATLAQKQMEQLRRMARDDLDTDSVCGADEPLTAFGIWDCLRDPDPDVRNANGWLNVGDASCWDPDEVDEQRKHRARIRRTALQALAGLASHAPRAENIDEWLKEERKSWERHD